MLDDGGACGGVRWSPRLAGVWSQEVGSVLVRLAGNSDQSSSDFYTFNLVHFVL
jgi:hypothetical protein